MHPPPTVRLRRPPPPDYPRRPYPVLGHYTHPDLLAGRDHDLAELRRPLTRRVPILGLFAPSGSGKSSLLAGGLLPALAVDDRPAVLERHPSEPRLVRKLLTNLMEDPSEIHDDDPVAFADALAHIHRAAAQPPVLILDQFEDVLIRDQKSRLGRLLAATVEPIADLEGPPCRWILAYRHEYHGELVRWLSDVEGPRGARNLSGSDRFQSWPVPVLAAPVPGTRDPAQDATRVFFDAITRPLALEEDGAPRYPHVFADGHAERLAAAFGQARARNPTAPLVPELQVVLERLLASAEAAGNDGVAIVQVPDNPEDLIDEALEAHLKRALERAFPLSGRRETRILKTRAVLALRELADVHGRRERGTTVEVLARAIGENGRDVLEELATERTRLVVLEEHDERWCYVLSHDRLAKVLVKLVDEEGDDAGLGIDARLLRLRRLVTLQSQLFAAGDREEATKVASGDYEGIEENTEALLWDDEQRRWWTACRERRRQDRRRRKVQVVVATAGVVLVVAVASYWANRILSERTTLARIPLPSAETALQALVALDTAGVSHDKLLNQLRKRQDLKPQSDDLLAFLEYQPHPLDVLDRGLVGVDQDKLTETVFRVVKLVQPLLAEEPDDPVRIASVVWALDFVAARDPASAEQAWALRERVLEPLRRKRPPPEVTPDDWVDIRAGSFQMGSPEGEGTRHEVTISSFRLLRHEVTNAEYRRLFPEHAPGEDDDLPAAYVTWYEAYTYAAWLSGRLPTEAEWEYAARANCEYPYCLEDGSEGTVDLVAWTSQNSERRVHPVMGLEPNPWGLYDMLANLWEWTADGFATYPETSEKDPWRANSVGWRVTRGGSFGSSPGGTRVATRGGRPPDFENAYQGFRVARSAGRPEL